MFAMQAATAFAHFFAGRYDAASVMGGSGDAGTTEFSHCDMRGRGKRCAGRKAC